jgi:opacity protein-like surface antigen
MLALALVLLSAAGPDDLDLPRTLSVDVPPPKEEFDLWIGGHLGVAGAYDADHPAFVIGGNVRAQILPWLGVDGSLDFQTKQEVDNSADIFQIPFMATALFYPPFDLPVRLYGQAGFGWTITNVSNGDDDTDLNLLFHLGFGAEFDLADNLMLDANVRFVFATDPPHSGDFSADWAQFTVGILFRLSK